MMDMEYDRAFVLDSGKAEEFLDQPATGFKEEMERMEKYTGKAPERTQKDFHVKNCDKLELLNQLFRDIEDLEKERPYKVPGLPDTYCEYNEAWQDSLDRVKGILEGYRKEMV